MDSKLKLMFFKFCCEIDLPKVHSYFLATSLIVCELLERHCPANKFSSSQREEKLIDSSGSHVGLRVPCDVFGSVC